MNDKQSDTPNRSSQPSWLPIGNNIEHTKDNNKLNPPIPNTNTIPKTQELIMKASVEKSMIGFFKNRTNTLIAIILAILVGVIFTVLVVEYSLKLNLFIFYAFLLGVTGYIMYKDNNLNIKAFIFLGISFLFLSSVFFRYSFIGYTVIATLLLPFIYILITIYASKQEYTSNIKTFLYRSVCSVGFVHKIIVALASLKTNDNVKKKQAIHILIGAGITVALLCIIIPLMLSADEMFKTTLKNMFGSFENLSTFILKSMLAAIISMVFFGFIYIITAQRLKMQKPKIENQLPQITTIILTITIVLAFVFSFFAIVQFNYLFVGISSNLPNNFDYAEYAKTGYFQLVVLSIINFFIILSSSHLSKNGSQKTKRAIRIILTYFNALNIYLLASAAYKMALYQNRYGLTSSRVLVYILLCFEAVLLIGLMIKIFKNDIPFVKYTLFYCIAFWSLASFVNVEALSLQYNINTRYETGALDFDQIRRQSPDSSQVVYEFYEDNYNDFNDDELLNFVRYYEMNFFSSTKATLTDYKNSKGLANWREYNISDQRFYNHGMKILKKHY